MQRRLLMMAGALTALALACSPAAAPSPTSAPATTASPIKMSIARTSGPASALLFIADDQGFLKNNGLDVDIRNFPSSGDAVNAFIAGDIVGAQPGGSLTNRLTERGFDFKILGVVSRNPRDEKVMATADINKPEDLKGKKVVVVPGTSSEFAMGLYLKKGGLTMDDVEVIKADAPEIVAIMDRGEAQAFVLWEPFPSNAMQVMGNKVKRMAYDQDLGLSGALHQVMSTKFLTENPEAGTRLMKAYLEAEKFIKANPDKAIDIVAKATRLEVAAAKPLVEAAEFNLIADQQMADELKLSAGWQKEVGQIKDIPDLARFIDASHLQKADASRATVKP